MHVKLHTQWPICYGPDIFVFLCLFFLGPRRKSFSVSGLPRLSPFLSQLLFHEIWLLVFCFFSISFSAKPERSLLPCQPPLSAQHSVPKISPYQETILKLHSIKFAIPFQNRKTELGFFTEKQKPLILESQSAFVLHRCQSLYLLRWECLCLSTCFGQATQAQQTTKDSLTALPWFPLPKDNIHSNVDKERSKLTWNQS